MGLDNMNRIGTSSVLAKAGNGSDADLETPVRSETLRSQVVNILKHAIFYGKLQPEELLRELPLAKKLKVSQSTVREALAELERYGLVVRILNRGTVVASLSSADIQNRMKVRLALEEMAFSDACLLLDDDDIAHLDELARTIDSLADAGQSIQAGEADLAFHRYVWRKTGNQILYQTLDVLTVPLFAFLGVMLNMAGIEQYRTLALPHHELVEALRQRDPEVAKEAIRAHLAVARSGAERVNLYSGRPQKRTLALKNSPDPRHGTDTAIGR
jgi:DNA-binding GntR family transcriptional regulator